MSWMTKFKTAVDYAASIVKTERLLLWAEKDGEAVKLRYKDEAGSTGTVQGEPPEWADITGKPNTYPAAWDGITGKPNTYPTAWAGITGKPNTYPAAWDGITGKPDLLPLSGGTMTGELRSATINALRLVGSEYGVILRSDGRSLYWLLTDRGNPTGNYNSLRPFSISLSTGVCDISGTAQKAVADGNGNNIASTYVTKKGPTFLSGIEISGDTSPFIDFHFAGSAADYTSRIIETTAGTLEIRANLRVTGTITGNMATSPAAAMLMSLQAPAAARMIPLGDDASALTLSPLCPEWEAGAQYEAGDIVNRDGQAYRVVQAVTAQEHQPPESEGMLAVYRPLMPEHEGTKEDPIPYLDGMDVESGKYYSYDGKLYRAAADMPACVWPPGTDGVHQWEVATL